MSANANTGNEFVSMIDQMDEESKKGGNFFKMAPTDQKTITVLTNPEKGISSYDQKEAQQAQANGQQPTKPPRTTFKIKVLEAGSQTEQVWEFSHRSIMQQLVALVRQYQLKTLVGAQLMIKTSGTDNKNRAWFIMLLGAPGLQGATPAMPAQPQMSQQPLVGASQ